MSKKSDKEERDRIKAAYDALYNASEDVPVERIREALNDAGVDREALRRRLHERAQELARAGRAKGRGASSALVRLLDQTSDAASIPPEPKRALEKARRYMADLFSGGSAYAQFQVVGAFRGKGDLTERDKETIDEIDAELRARAESEEPGEPSS